MDKVDIDRAYEQEAIHELACTLNNTINKLRQLEKRLSHLEGMLERDKKDQWTYIKALEKKVM